MEYTLIRASGCEEMDEKFWENQKLWPKDPPGHVFLARAFEGIGQKMFGDQWNFIEDELAAQGEHSADADDEIEDASVKNEWDTLDQRKIDVQKEIAKQCLQGRLVTAIRSKAGGKMIELNPSQWNTEDYSGRFYGCQMFAAKPFVKGSIVGSHFIYITQKSLDDFLSELSSKAVASVKKTKTQEIKCREWLVPQMRAQPKPPKPKAKYRTEAKEKFGTGTRAFDRAWADSVQTTEAVGWSAAGRKPKHKD